MVADRVADNGSSATHALGEGTPRPQNRVADNKASATGGRWLQMVADKTEHLQPHQTTEYQRIRPYFKSTVAELQIKSKNFFL